MPKTHLTGPHAREYALAHGLPVMARDLNGQNAVTHDFSELEDAAISLDVEAEPATAEEIAAAQAAHSEAVRAEQAAYDALWAQGGPEAMCVVLPEVRTVIAARNELIRVGAWEPGR